MQYFKDIQNDNTVYAFDDEQMELESVIKTVKSLKKMTKSEVDRHLNPEKYFSDQEKRNIFLRTLTPLTRRQFKLALLENELLEKVESTIDNIPDLQLRKRMQIEYAESVEFERQSESVIAMCEMLELSEDQVDQLWQHAMTL
ncbi:hypothetical protein KTH46_19075 [Acinetobacter bereziniae]|uniref:hypothetical protein n=1 Tax=Acinetobacter bereziniae TaxID=106648 RepID=UPI0021D251A3|nr:hypothetical protein [Acinetobacter bereziniae]MCU4317115.1 hypothetical protein [Acinetobacter bereziniae]